jgi:hypothetical protein
LTTIDQALDDFARNAKAEVALDTRGYDAGERSRAHVGGLCHGDFR